MTRPLPPAALLFAAAALTTLPGFAPEPPLASDAVIDAAEQAPLDEWSKSGRWNEPYAPFRVMDNIYYVGTEAIGAYLVATPKGHILIDGAIPQSAPQIIANIKALDFDIRDIRILLNSHAHFDHAGGLAGLKRASGARLFASAADRGALEAGRVDYGPSKDLAFPPVRVNRVIKDGETLRLGGAALTAHLTPGHTRGCTSWSMKVKGADGAPHTAFFHCSVTVAGQSLVPESWPGMVDAFRATFARVAAVKADIFLGNHDVFFDLAEKRHKLDSGDADAFVDPGELQRFNTALQKAFETELAHQKAAAETEKP